ncbi:MAG: nicotinate phosphoribosyltransferase [bacterium]|nr:nicotinate phosphoribosyltransferase [bacterium]
MIPPYSVLHTDYYQLTMAYGYFRSGIAEKNACFQLFFRTAPFSGTFTIACGLKNAIDFIRSFRFCSSDIEYLKNLKDPCGNAIFSKDFLLYLHNLQITCNVEAITEGTLVFAREPLLRITGPLLQCQLLESALLNIINFQTLIATKAARIKIAAGSDDIIEFGLRRAQGFDGACSATRAAFIGGIKATSNVFAAIALNIPVTGTMGHSWIMAFQDEFDAFEKYTEIMPHNTTLLVDTYNSLTGIKNAIKIAKKLQIKKQNIFGIRLDSGDLLSLSQTARQLLDQANLQDVKIIAGGDLDEHKITHLRNAHAPIDTWAIGTRLITAYEEPALNGTYKLVALEEKGGWKDCVKISDDPEKTTLPGATQVRRFTQNNQFICDVIFSNLESKTNNFPNLSEFSHTDLLVPILDKGKLKYIFPTLLETQKHAATQISSLKLECTKLINPSNYDVTICTKLSQKQATMIIDQKRKLLPIIEVKI